VAIVNGLQGGGAREEGSIPVRDLTLPSFPQFLYRLWDKQHMVGKRNEATEDVYKTVVGISEGKDKLEDIRVKMSNRFSHQVPHSGLRVEYQFSRKTLRLRISLLAS
jgi:hypothetical protein